VTVGLPAVVTRPDPWRWQPHVEVWVLVAALAVLAWWAVTRVGRRAARPGEPVLTRGQLAWGVGALALLAVASDWPVHDLAEEYLYSVHMGQHLLLSYLIPPMVLLATPTWLARLVVGSGRAYAMLRRVARPVPATVLFNAVVVLLHWPAMVEAATANGALHYGLHVLLLGAALLMWLPVCGPLPELRLPLPTQMVYLFAQSIVPTVPAGWLTFAEGVVYPSYDVLPRVFGLSVIDDQQIAGMLMKVLGGFFLWTVIAVLFVRFASRHLEDDRARGVALDRRAPVRTAEGELLTWEQVERELSTAGPAPRDPLDRG
jgi:putative membrane protein